MSTRTGPLIGSEKYACVHAGQAPEIGITLAFGAHGIIFSTFASLMFLLSALALYGVLASGDNFFLAPALITAGVGAACVYAGKIFVLPPTDPLRAVRGFFAHISRGGYRRAWQMLVPLEREAGTSAFADFQAFRDYWRAVRKSMGLKGGLVQLNNLSVETLGQDLVVVRGSMEVMASSVPIPTLTGFALVSLGQDRMHYLQKVLVRQGRQWLLWSPVLAGPDEADLSWTSVPATEPPKAQNRPRR